MWQKIKIDSRVKWLAFALILFVFGNSWEPGIGLDTATYGAIAKDILANGAWFNPKLAHGIFDPFVEHPYLALWLDALSLKIWGATALGIHFTSSVLGILGVLAFFAAIRRLVDENTALLTTILLLTVNVFMNFMSSGWMDMPMVAFILIGFYFSSKISDDDDLISVLMTGIFLSLAVLTKGVAAVGIFPVLLFAATRFQWRLKPLAVLTVGFFTPLIAFTLTHYQSQGFLFWKEYFYKQFVVHNGEREAKSDPVGWIWYIRDAVHHAHIVALLFIPGLFFLWKKQYRWVAVTATLQFLVHLAVYAFSNRHNRQYLVPIFPWLALGAGYLVSLRFKLNAEKWTKGIFYLSVVYFAAVAVLPITIHTMSCPEIYAFRTTVQNSGIKNIYFEATEIDRTAGDMISSYVSWYLDKNPVMIGFDEVPKTFAALKNEDAILLQRSKANNQYLQTPDVVCGWNDVWILVSTKENCASLDRKKLNPPSKR